KLLSRGSTSKRSAVMFSAAKTTKVEQAFRRTRKGNTHAIEQIDDRRRHFAHCFGRRLIREKVAAVNGVVEMFPGGIAFAFGVDRAVDAALRANRMRPFHWDDGEKIHLMSALGDTHRGRKACQTSANDRDLDSVTR